MSLELHALLLQDIILSHPWACMAEMSKDDSFSVIWDSGASMCISGDKQDFISELESVDAMVKGITGRLEIKGK